MIKSFSQYINDPEINEARRSALTAELIDSMSNDQVVEHIVKEINSSKPNVENLELLLPFIENIDGSIDILEGDSLLIRAAFKCNLTVLEFLLAHGADPNASDKWGTTPLIGNSNGERHNDRVAIAEVLLNHGADINAVDSSGCSALHYASIMSHADLTRYLLSKGADKSLRTKTTKKSTAWDLASPYIKNHLPELKESLEE